ncbi:DUF3558 domain-containing protein [Nocardia farcinica]|uniref:DUF3558 domain-containing protein n=1 Tax=Nocardia farcinica TaxID=37329 RepID=UPI00189617A3|nr:DUF3558 domain-containing protein [Nocardia farcinica]MBF6254991.1 DUF3558 domain-containing protein [Nocardia farcinica]MBF6420074.1 DUF3558 domain-containing protein [Nocardia farcinica]MBF6431551.1 DUF3558 domain-containing protein [Nocardia farcinica]MBF6503648.1 DUF3558 domain-containing protein [Nocardia farcinica]MBF6522555.1 DUF3558 domain-containing protein [Nocardia farcinica]
MRRVLVVVAAAAVVPVLGACGGTTSGTATTSTGAVEVALWNPCTEIPEDLLRQLDVDPATEESGIAGVEQSGWEICKWAGREYFLTVYSTRHTVREIEQKPGNVEFAPVTVGSRTGQSYRVEGAGKTYNCDIVFSARQGAVSLRIGNRASGDNSTDPCTTARAAADVLVPVFPG